ncbi:MAG: hypothetical protein ABW046_22645 [Actinoplanes sp.]
MTTGTTVALFETDALADALALVLALFDTDGLVLTLAEAEGLVNADALGLVLGLLETLGDTDGLLDGCGQVAWAAVPKDSTRPAASTSDATRLLKVLCMRRSVAPSIRRVKCCPTAHPHTGALQRDR